MSNINRDLGNFWISEVGFRRVADRPIALVGALANKLLRSQRHQYRYVFDQQPSNPATSQPNNLSTFLHETSTHHIRG